MNLFLLIQGSENMDNLQQFIAEETQKEVECALKYIKGTFPLYVAYKRFSSFIAPYYM